MPGSHRPLFPSPVQEVFMECWPGTGTAHTDRTALPCGDHTCTSCGRPECHMNNLDRCTAEIEVEGGS